MICSGVRRRLTLQAIEAITATDVKVESLEASSIRTMFCPMALWRTKMLTNCVPASGSDNVRLCDSTKCAGASLLQTKVKAAVMTGPGRIESQDFSYPETTRWSSTSKCAGLAEPTNTRIAAGRSNMAARPRRNRRRIRSSRYTKLLAPWRRSVGARRCVLDRSWCLASAHEPARLNL